MLNILRVKSVFMQLSQRETMNSETFYFFLNKSQHENQRNAVTEWNYLFLQSTTKKVATTTTTTSTQSPNKQKQNQKKLTEHNAVNIFRFLE